MDENVALGVELRGLGDAFHFGDFGQDLSEQAGFVQQFESPAGLALGEHFGELVADALAADGVDTRSELADRGVSGGVEGKAEAGGEADGAEEAELVFFEAAGGRADGAEDSGVEVGEAAYVVEEPSAECFAHGGRWPIGGKNGQDRRIKQKPVDGEVAALGVFLGACGVADFVRAAAVGVGAVGAKRGHFGHHLRWGRLCFGRAREFCSLTGSGDQDDAEVGSDCEGAGEHF